MGKNDGLSPSPPSSYGAQKERGLPTGVARRKLHRLPRGVRGVRSRLDFDRVTRYKGCITQRGDPYVEED